MSQSLRDFGIPVSTNVLGGFQKKWTFIPKNKALEIKNHN